MYKFKGILNGTSRIEKLVYYIVKLLAHENLVSVP